MKDEYRMKIIFHPSSFILLTLNSGDGETRTLTGLRPHGPKPCSAANYDTPPQGWYILPELSGFGKSRKKTCHTDFPEVEKTGKYSD